DQEIAFAVESKSDRRLQASEGGGPAVAVRLLDIVLRRGLRGAGEAADGPRAQIDPADPTPVTLGDEQEAGAEGQSAGRGETRGDDRQPPRRVDTKHPAQLLGRDVDAALRVDRARPGN